VLALVLCTVLAAGPGVDDGAAVDPSPGHRTQVPALRLGGGAFTLTLNTGWFGEQRAAGAPSSGNRFDLDGGIDLREQRGRLRLGGGDERRLRLAVQWDVDVDSEMARVHSQIDLGLFGHALTLTPPDVRVRPRFDGGQPGIEVNVPIVEGRF